MIKSAKRALPNTGFTIECSDRIVDNPKRLPILYLHGWGCSRHDFDGAYDAPGLEARRLVAFDQPGCGGSAYHASEHLGINDLVEATHELVTQAKLGKFILMAHSMGGAVAIRYIQKHPESVAAFINVVGNMNANDCFITRKVATGEETRDSMIARFKDSSNPGFATYAKTLEHTDPTAYVDYAQSAIDHSDSGELLPAFLGLKLPKVFMYCADSKDSIDYLGTLRQHDVPLVEIPTSDHFPGYDNPDFFYNEVAKFADSIG